VSSVEEGMEISGPDSDWAQKLRASRAKWVDEASQLTA
jgi:hypothetical protein